ncbi:MAG: hypothetical protein M1840_004119 [Geoglossum simile]|nr:MAG: hypothetical protein M1840_004119 [Geoglossum simile]
MDAAELSPLIDQLEAQIDDLLDALEPLLSTALSHHTAPLPLLDKAKLYVLVTYAIESLLFSTLRLGGANAREHPVFKELTRVRHYFEKIKQVEASGIKRENLSLDKEAASRFVKHALAGNEKYDLERAEQQAKERAKAHIKFEQLSRKRKAADSESTSSENSERNKGSANTQHEPQPSDADQIGGMPGRKDLSSPQTKRITGTDGETGSGHTAMGSVNKVPPISTSGSQPPSGHSTVTHDPLEKPYSHQSATRGGTQQGIRKKPKVSASKGKSR